MNKRTSPFIFILLLAGMIWSGAVMADESRPGVQWSDVAGWKFIQPQSVTISENGQWMAYWYSPNKGNAELILQHTSQDIKKNWPIGETGGNPGAAIAFSSDDTYLAFTVFPTEEARKRASRDNQPRNKVRLINLDGFEEKDFENMRSFSFGGEQHPGWLAIHLSTPVRGSGSNAGSGTDLLLYKLNEGTVMNFGNVSSFAFNKTGQWLAYTVDAYAKAGNGVFLRNMGTGEISVPESDKAKYKSLRWTEKGEGFTVLKEVSDDNWKDDLHHVVAFRPTRSGFEKIIIDPANTNGFPDGMTVSPNRAAVWSDNLASIYFGIHFVEKKEDAADNDTTATDQRRTPANRNNDDEEKPDIVLWHWQDSRLQSVQQTRERMDRDFNYLSVYHVQPGRFVQLADDQIKNVSTNRRGAYAIGFDNMAYELLGSLSGRNYRDIYKINVETGERKMILEKLMAVGGTPVSPDGTYMLYYDQGHYYTYHLADDRIINITENLPTSFVNELSDINLEFPPTPAWGWTSDSREVVLRDNHDVWRVQANGRGGENLTLNGRTDDMVYQMRFRLDEDEDGIDLRQPLYMRVMDNATKQTGIARIDRGRPGARMLILEEAMISGLTKADKAGLFFYARQTPQIAPNYYVTSSADLRGARRLTEVYPEQENFAWSPGEKLISFVSDKGDTLQAAIYLPANYEEGKSYPTVVYIYERLTQNLFSYARPAFPGGGFNRSIYTSNGYVVLMPDIAYQINDPGMSAVWCVLPALDAAIATGIVDADNVAIHGHSWGGYQTSHLITQTNRFKAAVAGAALTNMISMYSLIYWNTGGTNQAIFESSQGRFTSGYWDNWEAYKRNSPVYFASQVETPLLLMHNDKDGAVDFTQGIEYYNTLRRLEKPVIMLQYVGENHGLRKLANQIDYATRMMEFIDHYLKGKEAPTWLQEGVPLLEMDKHLEARPSVLHP